VSSVLTVRSSSTLAKPGRPLVLSTTLASRAATPPLCLGTLTSTLVRAPRQLVRSWFVYHRASRAGDPALCRVDLRVPVEHLAKKPVSLAGRYRPPGFQSCDPVPGGPSVSWIRTLVDTSPSRFASRFAIDHRASRAATLPCARKRCLRSSRTPRQAGSLLVRYRHRGFQSCDPPLCLGKLTKYARRAPPPSLFARWSLSTTSGFHELRPSPVVSVS